MNPEPNTPSAPTSTPVRPPPSLLWLTDRSRVKTGLSRCPRQRYLSTIYGPTGYGITARRDALPLVTGSAVHQGLEGFARLLQTHDRLPDLAETRAIVRGVVARYEARVAEHGYRGILGSAQTEETIAEQSTLIAGLLWTLRLKFLPWFLPQFRVVAVEEERLHLLRCTCGAPPLDIDEHVRRGCTGQALQIRTDLLAQRRSGSSLAYFECKTTGWESDAWAEQWETDPQLGLGTLDVPAIYGSEVTELYIIGLNKGRRARDRDDPTGPKRQQSPLCVSYCRPANPPLMPEDRLWAAQWVDESGETRRASRAHRREPVHTLEQSDWPVWRAYKQNDPELTPAEFWTRMLPTSLLDRVQFTLGPMNRQDHQLSSVLRAMQAEEDRWQEASWKLYELQAAGHAWGSAIVQSELDRLIPQSWACRPFGREHQCEFVPICHHETGWEDPLASGGYQPRLPHHEPELQQAIARGLLPAEAAEQDEEEG